MNKIIFLLIIFYANSFSQENRSNQNLDLFSPPNIKKFADYLFCQHDYLRASIEYEKYIQRSFNDTVAFKIGLANMAIGNFENASKKFFNISQNSVFYNLSRLEYLRANFQTGNFNSYRNLYGSLKLNPDYKYFFNARELYNFSFLFTDNPLPQKKIFINSFPDEEQNKVDEFYSWKSDPPYKSSVTAALLSTVIPGLGKVYTHKYSDGIFAFVTVSLLCYLAYADFHANHNFRGWLFSALGAGFYGGNIYGSAASAQIFNAKIKFQFFNDLKNFLEEHNYFVPVISFCK
jgi:hypothetical protein